MKVPALGRRVYDRLFIEVPVNQWKPPFRTYTITTNVLLVALLVVSVLRFVTDIPGPDMVGPLLFLTWLLAQRVWLRSILKDEGLLPPGE